MGRAVGFGFSSSSSRCQVWSKERSASSNGQVEASGWLLRCVAARPSPLAPHGARRRRRNVCPLLPRESLPSFAVACPWGIGLVSTRTCLNCCLVPPFMFRGVIKGVTQSNSNPPLGRLEHTHNQIWTTTKWWRDFLPFLQIKSQSEREREREVLLPQNLFCLCLAYRML